MEAQTITAQLATAGLDPRMTAARTDLADATLCGVIDAARYAVPDKMACALPFTPLFDSRDGEQSSELLNGEHFMQLEAKQGWAWGYCAHDHYVGYCRTEALDSGCEEAPVSHSPDPVTFALQFVDMPYVWGGRGGGGIDCSGLVQRSMAAVGIAALRDSDMQRETLGALLPATIALQRGDVIFFPGHVGMMVDGQQLIHATRYHQKTVVEPLDVVVARVIRKHGMGIMARKRVKW